MCRACCDEAAKSAGQWWDVQLYDKGHGGLMEQIVDRDIKNKQNWMYKSRALRFRWEVKAVKLKSIVKTYNPQ